LRRLSASIVVSPSHVSFHDAVRFWVRLGFINFGGPTGQIAIMHEELVQRRRWIDEPHFLHALNFAMLLPGPEAHQLAIYVGWLLNGAPGAIAAGVLFLLPAFFLIVVLSWVYAVHGDISWVSAVFDGLAWAVVGIVAAALVRIGTRALTSFAMVLIAFAAFIAVFLVGVPFPVVVVIAGIVGLLGGERLTPTLKACVENAQPIGRPDVRTSLARTARVLGVGAVVWLGPLAAIVVATRNDVLAEEALFFSVMALVTFGGAYAVLAYVNQAAVLRFGWLTSGEMAVGLSLAETTPGPLILVVVFVGFLAAYRQPGTMVPLAAAFLGSVVAAWATFVPSFLFIFLGAPSVERLRGNRRLAAGLAAITAAVVGVVANLAAVFAISVLFEDRRIEPFLGHEIAVPVLASADVLALAVAAGAFLAMQRYRMNVVWIVLSSGLIGLARALL
jgi:chromate transporter